MNTQQKNSKPARSQASFMQASAPTNSSNMLSTKDDGTLVTLLFHGDSSAMTTLWTRHRHTLINTAATHFSQLDAEDLVAETLTHLFELIRLQRIKPVAFGAYAHTTLCRIGAGSVHYLQTLNSHATVRQLDKLSEIDVETRFEAVENIRLVRQAFDKLSFRWRHTLWLVHCRELKVHQAAELLELSPNATSQLAKRALNRLRREWRKLHRSQRHTGQPDYC